MKTPRLRDIAFSVKLKLLVVLAAAGPLLLASWVLLERGSETARENLAILLALLTTAAVVLLLTARVQRALTRPLVRLGEAARRVSEDKDYSVRVPVTATDEVGRLTAAFNEMLSQIQERDSALLAARDEIEERVHERVAERVALEEKVRQSQKMEAVGRLAGGVAHDFNNLLGVILGYAELLRRGMAPGARDEQRLGQILKAADRAANLTGQLLAFSRKQVLDPRVLDLGAVVAELEGMLSRLTREDLGLRVQCEPGLWTIKADRGQIEQVVLNLAANGRDAMPQGGSLGIQLANAGADDPAIAQLGLAAGRYVRLAVQDTGEGMDRLTVSHVFEPFFSARAKGDGTGLGLATAYGVVSQSGGAIAVDSAPGQGSTFTVYLPAVEQGMESTPLATPPPASGLRRVQEAMHPA